MKEKPDFVIKVHQNSFPKANMIEWVVWEALVKMSEDIMGTEPNSELQEQFARCFEISETAKYLMMERLNPLGDASDFNPNDWPSWLNDKKPSAFGTTLDGDRIKAMDYAAVNFYEILNPLNRQSLFS